MLVDEKNEAQHVLISNITKYVKISWVITLNQYKILDQQVK